MGDAIEVISRTTIQQYEVSDAITTMVEAIMAYIHDEGPLTFTHQIITIAKGIIGITEMPDKLKREIFKGNNVPDHLLYYVWATLHRLKTEIVDSSRVAADIQQRIRRSGV